MEAKRNSETFEIIGRKGTYISQGVGGPLTGKKVDLGIIDDPIKNSKEALSPTVKQAIWNWYVSTFKTRLSKKSGEIIMATRWAEDDLSGLIIKNNKKAKSIVFKAIDDDGNALVPELHPIDKLIETKELIGDYFWSAMYQQSPKPSGGTIFKEAWIKYYFKRDLPVKFDEVIASWDMTFKDSDNTDYVVGQVWGKHKANSYLIHQVRERLSFTDTVKAVKMIASKYPAIRAHLIEDKANGPAVISTLKGVVSGIIPVEPDDSKVARAHAMTAEIEAGNVFFPHPDECDWINDTISEITSFPVGAHDDSVDAMTQAIRRLYDRNGISVFDVLF